MPLFDYFSCTQLLFITIRGRNSIPKFENREQSLRGCVVHVSYTDDRTHIDWPYYVAAGSPPRRLLQRKLRGVWVEGASRVPRRMQMGRRRRGVLEWCRDHFISSYHIMCTTLLNLLPMDTLSHYPYHHVESVAFR